MVVKRRKRKMTRKQIKYFGTKRQRAALRRRKPTRSVVRARKTVQYRKVVKRKKKSPVAKSSLLKWVAATFGVAAAAALAIWGVPKILKWLKEKGWSLETIKAALLPGTTQPVAPITPVTLPAIASPPGGSVGTNTGVSVPAVPVIPGVTVVSPATGLPVGTGTVIKAPTGAANTATGAGGSTVQRPAPGYLTIAPPPAWSPTPAQAGMAESAVEGMFDPIAEAIAAANQAAGGMAAFARYSPGLEIALRSWGFNN